MNEPSLKISPQSIEDKNTDLPALNILDTIENEQKNISKKFDIGTNSILKRLIIKVKDELAKEEIKNEINNIVHPLYIDIYNEVYPYYITLTTILILIAFLLILIIILQVISYKQTNK
jgi:hypothetical protein